MNWADSFEHSLFGWSYRYKPLCPATWPHWRGVAADGVEVLVQHLGYLPDEYKMGRWGSLSRYLNKSSLCKESQKYKLLICLLQDQNFHPSPQDTVRHRGCLWEMQTWTGWVSTALNLQSSCLTITLIYIFCSGFAATRIQAKYKGYRAKGEYRKQKEAGKCHNIQNDRKNFVSNKKY